MRMLNWGEFDLCIESITKSCKKKEFSGVYGFPRGGLCLAVALSHSIGIPFLNEIKPGCLVVDDVYETGETFRKAMVIPGITAFVWISKVTPMGWNAVVISNPDEWLVFPWENPQFAKEDMLAYKSSKNQSR